MRQFTVRGKTVKVSEKDYEQLLRRFDIERAKLEDEYYRINASCICNNHCGCWSCPLNILTKCGVEGCAVMLKSLKLYPEFVNVSWISYIRWNKKDDAKARKEVQAIRQFIESWEKVKRGRG